MRDFFTNNPKLTAAVAILLVVFGAGWYIYSNQEPKFDSYVVSRGSVAAAIDESAVVAAEKSSNIAFQSAGRITRVYIKDGQKVSAGDRLAELDAASLEKNVEQANAALAAAESRLEALEIGATPQTIAVSKSALDSANQELNNNYAKVPDILNDAYAKASDAVRNQLFAFFSSPESAYPQLTFNVNDLGLANKFQYARSAAGTELNNWQNELASNDSSNAGNLQSAVNHLSAIQNLMNLSMTALAGEIGLSPATVAAYKNSAATGLNEVNAANTAVSNLQQAIASAKAAVAQSQAGLDLATASSTKQAINEQKSAVAAALAAVSAAKVNLNNAILVAPFPGVAQNVTAEVGEVVSPGLPVLTLVNSNGLKIQTYVSELDIAKIKIGGAANITLDAFGADTIFPATVTAVDSAETKINGVPSYLITLHFTDSESKAKSGMTGNTHLIFAENDNAVAVPSRLILNDNNQNFVLVKTTTGIKKQSVQIGSIGDNGLTEILSGININNELVNF